MGQVEKPPVSEERRRRVQKAVDAWVKQLVDLTGNNQLLYYRTLPQGTLELTEAETASRCRLLGDAKVSIGELFPATEPEPERTDRALKRARTIHNRALAIFEEKGIDTLYLALGMATWTSTTSSSTPAAPVLLRRVAIEPRGAAESEFDVRLEGDWQINETLLHLLVNDFRARVDVDELQARAEGLDGSNADAVRQLTDMLVASAPTVPDLRVTERVVVGTFAYTKLPMVKDLQASVDALAAHDLVAAIAGDDEARQAVLDARATDVSPSLPDHTPPGDEFLILDADSSQSYAINAAIAGEPLIIQGPPGTGKSQTIANLIASSAARGRRVLFVAEKRAAIEAVTKRLRAKGVDGLVMDLHSGLGSKKRFAAALGEAITEIESISVIDRGDLEHRLDKARRALVEHDAALHEIRDPWGVSIHEVDQRLIGLRDRVNTDLRFTASQVAELDANVARRLRDDLVEWSNLAEPLNSGRSPWAGAAVETTDDAAKVLDLVDEMAQQVVPEARDTLDAVLEETGLRAPSTIDGWQRTLRLLGAISGTLDRAEPEIFDLTADLAADLEPGRRGAVSRFAAQLFNVRYRRAKKTLRELWRGEGKPDGSDLAAAIDATIEQREEWNELGGTGRPRPPEQLDTVNERYGALQERLAALGAYLVSRDLAARRHDTIAADVEALQHDQVTLFRLPRIHELEGNLEQHHLGPLLARVRSGEVPGDVVDDVFGLLWLTAIRTTVVARDQRLSSFDGTLHSRMVQEFREADVEHLETTAARVRRAAAEHAVAVCNQHPEQDALVRREANKKSRHIPTRKLFDEAAEVLTALRPCWTMSPLVVSQVLPARQLFDLVIFDEASQVLPADAVPALLRAPQAVVAGDRRQLPPTTFFSGSDDGDEDDELEDAAVQGFESVLDVLDTALGSRMLMWHYRSEDERLIAFSNHKIYDSGLTTFPGAADDDCFRHVLIPHERGVKVDTRSNAAEVDKVVDLMLDHARNRPDESLGVIAMGQHHASRVEGALRQRLGELRDPDLDDFFDESYEERTFVKNIERVQGDERDAIILTVGYGKNSDGTVPYRFGPLNQDGGERRLNVAVTRARKRVTLVSSFSHVDMDPSRSSKRGVELLRQYLKYADSGGTEIEGSNDVVALNAFEIDVKHRLERAGLTVYPQYGVSRFRLDFALPHPEGKGFALAVEADGASYHSTPTARDRDRLRQQILEARGWRFHRIWSTDWFNDPDREARRVVEAYLRAVADIDAGHTQPVADEEARERASAKTADLGRPRRSGARPRIRAGAPITEYEHRELVDLARWITSDGLLRTEGQIIDEMMRELGYSRRGKRIVAALEHAVRSATGARN